MTREEEEALFRALRSGDPKAAQIIFTANQHLVERIAKTYRDLSPSVVDKVKAGEAGHLQAINRFDPGKGIRFSTYATHWVRQSIGRAVDQSTKKPPPPAQVLQSLEKLRIVRERLRAELNAEPTEEQLAKALGIALGHLRFLLAQETDPVS